MSISFFREFKDHNRFDYGDDGIIRVTAGHGGESVLIIGSEKTALIDCGMAYCFEALIENIESGLAGRALDHILISHTHYDHIGALPFIKRRWPKAACFGAEHAKKVFEKPGAIRTIRSLSENVSKRSGHGQTLMFPENGFAVDRTLRDGDRVSLGDKEIIVLETKGHTDCSMTFVLEPQRIMFLSESTGVLESPERIHVAILKDYGDAMASLAKCQGYKDYAMVSPHYGIMPKYFNDTYWDMFIRASEEKRIFLFELFEKKLSEEDVLKAYISRYWLKNREMEQPKEAFVLNAVNIIKVFFKEFNKSNVSEG